MTRIVKRIFVFVLMTCLLSAMTVSCTVLDKIADLSFKGNLPEKADWLQGLSADSVVKIDIKDSSYSVEPGSTDHCYYTENKEVIEKIIEVYHNLRIKRDTSGRHNEVIGGDSRMVTFTFADGHTEELYFHNGYYIQGLLVFDIVFGNKVHNYFNECERYSRFVTLSNEANVYTNTDEPQLVGKAENIELWEFVDIDPVEETDSPEKAMSYVDSSFGKIYVLSDTGFCVEKLGELSYYELTNGQTFGDFITFTTETE